LYWLARPRRRRGSAAHDATHRDEAADACHTRRVLFDGPRTTLPTATLLASGSQTRRRMDLVRWLSLRWDWVRPRAVPLLAAVVGLMLTLGAVKYTSLLAYDHDQTPRARAAPVLIAPAAPGAPQAPGAPAHVTRHGRWQGPDCDGTACAAGCSHRAAH
jgi:hypothetical protein